MERKEGDPCPRCANGKLTVHPDREVYENEDGSSGSHRTWVCDNPDCKHEARDFKRGIVETIDVSDSVSVSKGTNSSVTDTVGVSDSVDGGRDAVEPRYSVFFNKYAKRVTVHRIGYCQHMGKDEDPQAHGSNGIWGYFVDKDAAREFAEIIGKSEQVPVNDCKDCKSRGGL